jgi:hypothetical protein
MRVVLTSGAQTYIRFRTLAIPGVPETRATACAVFAYLRAGLNANNNVRVLQAIEQSKRLKMEQLFTALGSNRPAFAARLGVMANGVFTPTDAEIILVRKEGADLIGGAMRMARSADDVWRITGL